MERLTMREPFWLGEEFWTSAMEPDDEEIDAVYEKLKHYEDMEERLEKAYGECKGMLETIVSHLEKHEGIDLGNPGKVLLLTDDDVEKWEKQKSMKELTPVEITKMSHCVGLDYKNPYKRHGKKFYKPYRNYYATYAWNDIWNGLAGKGFAKHGNVDDETQETTFWLTRDGLDALGKVIGVHIYDAEI